MPGHARDAAPPPVVLAANGDDTSNGPVRRAAENLAAVLGVPLRTARPPTTARGSVIDLVREPVGAPPDDRAGGRDVVDVLAVVVAGELLDLDDVQLFRRVHTPVLVVPPGCQPPAGSPMQLALAPLDGDPATSAGVVPLLRALQRAGVDITALHVVDSDHVPAHLDQGGWGAGSWREEFLRRHDGLPSELVVHTGTPEQDVLEVLHDREVDLLVLCWSRNLAPGRARVVRAALEHALVPVLLVPLDPGDDRATPSAAVG